MAQREARNGRGGSSRAAEGGTAQGFCRASPLAEKILGAASSREEVKERLRLLLGQVARQDPKRTMRFSAPLPEASFPNFNAFLYELFIAVKLLAASRGVYVDLVDTEKIMRETGMASILGDVHSALQIDGKTLYVVENVEKPPDYGTAHHTRTKLGADELVEMAIFMDGFLRQSTVVSDLLFDSRPDREVFDMFAPMPPSQIAAFLSEVEQGPTVAGVLTSLSFAPDLIPDEKHVYGISFALMCRDLLKLRGLGKESFTQRLAAIEASSTVVHELTHAFFLDAVCRRGRAELLHNNALNEAIAMNAEIARGPHPFIVFGAVYRWAHGMGKEYFTRPSYALLQAVLDALHYSGVTPGQEPNVLLSMPEARLRGIAQTILDDSMKQLFQLPFEAIAPQRHFAEADAFMKKACGDV